MIYLFEGRGSVEINKMYHSSSMMYPGNLNEIHRREKKIDSLLNLKNVFKILLFHAAILTCFVVVLIFHISNVNSCIVLS